MVNEKYLEGTLPESGINDELLRSDNGEAAAALQWEIVPGEAEKKVEKPRAVVFIGDVEGDLDCNGQADIVLAITDPSHPSCGAAGAWMIQEDQTAAWNGMSTPLGTGTVVFGFGKTDANKITNDVYIYDASSKWLGAWVTDDNGNVTGLQGINVFNDNMNVIGLGDFNGDGQTDVLLRSDYGDVGCWFTSGAKTGWNYFQSLGEEWDLVAVGDFNADGRDDVVLTHAGGGFAGCWLTNEDGTVAWSGLDDLNGAVVIGAGDFNGDGTDDVLLKNGTTYGAWIVKEGKATAWMGLGVLGEDNTVEQIADFDGDGTDDLRVRVDNGAIGTLLVKGEEQLEWNYYGSVGSEWTTALASI